MGAGSTHKLHVVVRNPNDASDGEIVGHAGLWFRVERVMLLPFGKLHPQVPIREAPVEAESSTAESDRLGQRRGARRLQAQKHADGFEKGRLALRVRTDEEIQPGFRLKGKGFEASKIPKMDFAEHAGVPRRQDQSMSST